MEVVLEPPRAVQPGQLLYPPLVVGLRTGKQSKSDVRQATEHRASDAVLNQETCSSAYQKPKQTGLNEDHESLWAFVCLDLRTSDDPEDTSISWCPASELSGTLSDSPHRAPLEPYETGMRYFRFPNLTINSTGIFRLRVALCQMPCGLGEATWIPETATTIACVSTRDIAVQPSSNPLPLGKYADHPYGLQLTQD